MARDLGIIQNQTTQTTLERPNATGNYGDAVKSSLSSSVNTIKQGIDEANPSGSGGIRGLATGIGKIGAGAIGTLFSPVAPVLNATVGKGVQVAGDALSNTKPFKEYGEGMAQTPGAGKTGVEDFSEGVANYSTILGAVAGGPKAGTVATDVALDTANTAKNLVTNTPEQIAAKTAAKTEKAVTTITKDWKRPIETPKAAFNKARQVVGQSPDAPKFLAEQGIKPSTLIEDGKYATEDTASSLRDTAAKMSQDTLRPSLKAADYSTPRTQIGDLEESAIANARRTPNITAGNLESIEQNIHNEASSLRKKYPDGISLSEMHDNKITYAKNGGYSPFNDPKINNSATANRSFSSALGRAVENRAPKDIPVHEFNDYLSKYYEAADYLDALNTKTAPVTVGQTIVRGISKFGGAALGAKLGGDVVSAFAGYQIGKAIEHAMENMKPHMRDSFIRNLQVTNPEAFTKVQEYLNRQTSGNDGTPRLSAPSYIPMGPRATPPSQVTSVPAQKGPVGIDTATGRFKTTYTSSPK